MRNLRLALYQPEIAQNVGTMLRFCACFNVPVDVIEPTGFPWDDKRMRRAGMDYIDLVKITKYTSFDSFLKEKQGRIILSDVKATKLHHEFKFEPGDICLMGRESCGVPDELFDICEEKIKIPMVHKTRSLNVAVAAAIVVAEAIRQIGWDI
ncbi:MAG: hypothetical protein LBS83_03635 [Holosporales bacterium]|jgi:tRNA (cytidine/uridine-2'-O-)-methyltransferase|nr:hypothetical protein [Holosporales bacterium]